MKRSNSLRLDAGLYIMEGIAVNLIASIAGIVGDDAYGKGVCAIFIMA